MIRRKGAHCLTLLLAVLLAGHAQTSSPQASVKSDYSREAAVIEEMTTKLAFDNDGNSNREQTSRVRVQTDAGVQQWGLLSFSFQSAMQVVEMLTGTKAPTSMELLRGDPNGNELSQLRSVKLKRLVPGYGRVFSALQPGAEGARGGVHQRLRKAEARRKGAFANEFSDCIPGRQ